MTLKRTLAVLAFTLAAPLAFGQADETGAEPVRTPDRSTICTLDSLNDTCSVALEGRTGVGAFISTANLNATVVAEISRDGGTTWEGAYFVDNVSWGGSTSIAFSGGSTTKGRALLIIGNGVSHARVRVSIYASGTSTSVVRATAASGGLVVFQGDQSNIPWFVAGFYPDGFTTSGLNPLMIAGQDGANVQSLKTDSIGRLEITPSSATSANNDGACVSVTASTTVLASFATRRAFTLFARETNTDVVYIKMGTTATSADFPLPAGSAYNMQAGVVYTGVIDAIAASGTQSVCVVEF